MNNETDVSNFDIKFIDKWKNSVSDKHFDII